MPDNWGYVTAAYVFAALLLGVYWRHLIRRAADLARPRAARRLRREAGSWPASGAPPRDR
jgi:hypothetical protein